MMKNKVLLALILAISIANIFAQSEENYLLYEIPSDAKKLGPISTRNPREVFYNYFPSSAEASAETLIGRETYYDKQLIERELYKGGKQHGVQRKWYHHGVSKSESPYKEGVMEGVFKHWNEKGDLIGQYVIYDGKGTKKIYNDDGNLIVEKAIENSRGNGLWMETSAIGKLRSLVWLKNDEYIGKSFSFYPSGVLQGITCSSTDGYGYLQGPHIEFSEDGNVTKKQWYVNGKEIPETEYAAAAASDASLPPYYSDANQYKESVDKDVKALLEKYRTLPRVKIPLEFDEEGNPALAQ